MRNKGWSHQLYTFEQSTLRSSSIRSISVRPHALTHGLKLLEEPALSDHGFAASKNNVVPVKEPLSELQLRVLVSSLVPSQSKSRPANPAYHTESIVLTVRTHVGDDVLVESTDEGGTCILKATEVQGKERVLHTRKYTFHPIFR